jgi:hypothetical protein
VSQNRTALHKRETSKSFPGFDRRRIASRNDQRLIVVLDFVKGHVFDPADFVIRNDGVCRLNPEMARMVVAKVSA